MKILSISPKIPFPDNDGHTKSIFGLLKHLSMRGHQIDFVAYSQGKYDEKNINEIRKYATVHILNVLTQNRIDGIIKNLFSPVPYNISKYHRKVLKIFLQNYFKDNKVDIVHVTNAHMGWVVDEVRKLSKAKIVLRQENLELMIMKRYYKNQKNIFLKIYSWIQLKKFLKYEPSLCAKFDACVMMSKMDLDELIKYGSNIDAFVIPSGIESKLLSLKEDKIEPFSLYHYGSLEWYPNYDGVVWFINEILPDLVKEESKIKLYLYGNGISERLIIPEKLKEHIIVKGFIPDIWNEIKDKSLSIVPLRIGSGIRIKILELLASGKMVITTSLGKEGIPVEDNKHLLIADTADQFKEKILGYFNNDFNVERITSDGRELIKENYTWERIAERFEKLYKDISTN
jgi:glycosyltransferase involved in cell wall biosynthesis